MLNKDTVVKFLKDTESRFEKFASQYNPSGDVKKKSWNTPLGRLDAIVSNGKTFDKASSIYCDLKVDTPPVLAEKLGKKGGKADAMVLEFHFFPINPFIPKGYIELRANITDKTILAGGTDIFPYFPKEEDNKYFADGMKELCKRHGQDYEKLLKTRVDFFKSKYRPGKVGSHAGIYSFHLDEKDFDFFKDMADTYFKIYTDLVEKRKNEKFTEKDIEHKLRIHGLWAEWTMVEDEGTLFGIRKGIPPEALLGAILPPEAKFGIE